MQKLWKVLEAEKCKITSLTEALKINWVLCKILVQRGFDTFEKAKVFFSAAIVSSSRPLANEGYG
jgi:single-stranded-DNA-specific exonuclease